MTARARPNTARTTGTIPIIATSDTTTEIETDKHKHKKRCPTRALLRRNPCLGALVAVAILIAIHLLIRLYYDIESRITDPFLEAKLFMPLRYWQVSRQFAPSNQRNFTMNVGNAFVVNLPKDAERMKRFRQFNGEQAADRIQHAVAHQWVPDTKESRLTEKQVLDMQRMYEQRYPYLRRMARTGQYGNAGCSLSHIRVLEDFVSSTNSTEDGAASYIFVFEDDAQLLEPLKSTGVVTAPQDADVVFLLATSTKRVRVPYQGDDKEGLFAIRVIQGFGAVAYVVTKNGAEKILSYMRRVETDAIDLALINNPDLKVYHPSSTWPQVVHRPGRQGSIRRTINGNVRGTTPR